MSMRLLRMAPLASIMLLAPKGGATQFVDWTTGP